MFWCEIAFWTELIQSEVIKTITIKEGMKIGFVEQPINNENK